MNTICQKAKLPRIITVIFSILMIVCLFLPFATATEEYAEMLDEYSDVGTYFGVDAEDLENISLYNFYELYQDVDEYVSDDYSVLYCGLIIATGVLAVITLIFSIAKKAIPTIIFSVLSLGLFRLQCWDYADRGVVPSDNYDLGIGCYLFYIASVVVLVGAIWLLICKKKEKKAIQE